MATVKGKRAKGHWPDNFVMTIGSGQDIQTTVVFWIPKKKRLAKRKPRKATGRKGRR